MYIKELKNKEEWNYFVNNAFNPSFLQSWEWKSFLEKYKNTEVFALAFYNDADDIELLALVQKDNLKFFKIPYAYLAYAPVLKNLEASKYLEDFFKAVKTYLNVSFVLSELNVELAYWKNIQKTNSNLKKIACHIQVNDTFYLDLSQTEEEILSNMHHKTRYNIRLAKKKGVEIIEDREGRYFEDWYNIMQKTAERNNIVLLSKKHYKALVESSVLTLLLAKYKNKIIAGILVNFNGPIAVYVHGGSDYNYRNLMPAYLLQWYAIKKAKSLGAKYYDFWGINLKNHNPSWQGFSRFKKYFALKNGLEIEYISSIIYPFNFSAFLYYIFCKLRAMKKRIRRLFR